MIGKKIMVQGENEGIYETLSIRLAFPYFPP